MRQTPYNTPRLQQGGELLLRCQCVNADGRIVAPAAAPTVTIYSSIGASVWTGRLPPQNSRSTTGVFMLPLFLNSAFQVGDYFAFITWYTGAVNMGTVYRFEVVPGGNTKGQIIAGILTTQPQVRHIVHETVTGELFKGGNPVVD